MKLEELLEELTKEKKASDIHVKVGNKPHIRIDGLLRPLEQFDELSKENTQRFALSLMNEEQKKHFEQAKEVDFAISAKGGRFRVNIFQQRGSFGVVIRIVSFEHKTIEELHLPTVVNELAILPRGLVLVTGTTGSGKTTTIASMINYINSLQCRHIITVEDPIEILHSDIKSIINQRELGSDTSSYAQSLKHIVRQDPDVIFIGEIRDAETMDSAMKAAELGNLVFSTIHTIDATETINRIIDLYPIEHQKLVRIMLASTLKGIISLRLLPAMGGGRIPAVEVMKTTDTIRQYVLNPEETIKIKKAMEEGAYYGMQTFDQSLIQLLNSKKINLEDAMLAAENEHDFKLKLSKAG
ncbi:MAG: PilT/PilU family type 4a pilus ATPase [Actinobacteria bacterium]|nr:MAG: PilT/PilU family type 4a pilus ATPase [Actinomycetota bacterium]